MLKNLLKLSLVIIISVFTIVLTRTGIMLLTEYNYKTEVIDMAPRLAKENVVIIFGDIVNGPVFRPDPERPQADMSLAAEAVTIRVRKGVKDITLIIDSYGGSVSAGMRFIGTMKAAQEHGVNFTCIVRNKAMSMATIIFTECDTRRALFGSKIMWHSALVGYLGSINQGFLESNLERFKQLNNELWTKTKTFFTATYFKKHFDLESQIAAKEIERESKGYLRVINSYTFK